jgi:hypothetical protein
LECTDRIARRPARSGAPTGICRSNRPGRSSAGSRNVRPVRRGDQDDAAAGVEAVHLDEQLVQGLLALVVPAAEGAGAALAADRVDLVDEDDAGARSAWPARTGRAPGEAPTPTNISTKSDPEIV